MWLRSELKGHAKSVLKQNYWWVLTALVILLLASRGVGTISFFSVSDPDMFDSYLKNGSTMLRALFVAVASMATLLNTAISAALWCLVINPLTVGIQRFLVKSCRGG